MSDSIKTYTLKNVEVQENGIIRNEKGRLIARLVEGVEFEGEHIAGVKHTPHTTPVYGQPDTQGDTVKALETLHKELHTTSEVEQFKVNLKEVCSYSGIDMCPGCGLTVDGLEQMLTTLTTPKPTPEVEEIQWSTDLRDIIGTLYINFGKEKADKLVEEIKNIVTTLTTKHQEELEKAVEAERERILADILRWSKNATVVETTGREGANRATKKLRENLSGSYHFLYQAIHLTPTKTDKQ